MARFTRKPRKPCDEFRLVESEKTFGLCQCGFSLAEHMAQDEVEDDEIPPPPPSGVEEAETKEGGSGPCNNFTLNMKEGPGFGDCVCGYKKSEHKADDRATSSRISRTFASLANRLSKRFSKSKNSGDGDEAHPCSEFEVDLEGTQFGMCKCGFSKADHDKYAELLRIKEEKEKAKSQGGVSAAKQDTSKPCDKFELDMKSSGGYGVCVCGFKRDQHVDYSQKPGNEWQEVSKTLTKPKPFE